MNLEVGNREKQITKRKIKDEAEGEWGQQNDTLCKCWGQSERHGQERDDGIAETERGDEDREVESSPEIYGRL